MASESDIPTLLQDIASKGTTLDKEGDTGRRALLSAARSLFYKLETPIESLLRICWAEPGLHSAIRVGIELNLFEKLAADEGSIKETSQLAEMTGADPILLSRILKHLAAMGIIYETAADTYAPTPLSNFLIDPKAYGAFSTVNDSAGPPLRQLHAYLTKTNFQNPTNPIDGPFQYSHQTPLHLFAWFQEHPDYAQQFGDFMSGYRQGRPHWTNIFPVEEQLIKGASNQENEVLLVDVGGGMGADLELFRAKFPDASGRLVLQDQAETIERVEGKGEGKFEVMVHDFFEAQPVQGARAYYLHSVLHDWPETKCLEILAALKPAMKKGYSKLLINENVIPDKGAHCISTGLDMLVMAVFSGAERTEGQWRDILTKAGLRLVKIWGDEPGAESLIEAEVA